MLNKIILCIKRFFNQLLKESKAIDLNKQADTLDELYKKYPAGTKISDPVIARKFLMTGERVKYDGGVFPHECVGLHFNYHDFVNVSAKEATFKGCEFKYATLVGVYFKGAKFINCDFTGARFKDCNFKECSFSGSNFKYAEFSGTHIPNNEILLNMPAWLNVRRDLMKILRKNAESVGDTSGIKLFIREEIKASRIYTQEAWRHSNAYYRKKYPNFPTRVKLFLTAGILFLDDFFWGHGEYPLKLARFIIITLILTALIVQLNIPLIYQVSILDFSNLYVESFFATTYSFLGVIPHSSLPVVPEVLKILLALFRFVALGFFTTSLFRFLSRR